ncbi:hypothetical protein U27_00139 [Candidatus Vecturithrix granuli]|uniref:Uncharacterized protein n=1 Tax=Vecturithrix granuli TaxID=1499967 RepID=A0A081C6P3_VECG1|nr:hypothetical protein U27_00139 [Candidatus Vecturithrix granuli]
MKTTHDIITSKRKRHSWGLFGVSLLIICCLIGGWYLWKTYTQRLSTQEIYALLENRANGLRQKNLPQYLSCFSSSYRSPSQTFADLQTSAVRWFEQFVTIHFAFQILDIQFQGERALVENHYKFTLTDADGETLELSQRELLEIQREHGEWKITQSLSIQ